MSLEYSQPQPEILSITQEQRVHNAIIMGFKSNKECGDQRKQFSMCRATNVGKMGDPSYCEEQAANFMACHHEV
jgi:hypothetical protein